MNYWRCQNCGSALDNNGRCILCAPSGFAPSRLLAVPGVARHMHVAAVETAVEKAQRTPNRNKRGVTKWASIGGGHATPQRGSRTGTANILFCGNEHGTGDKTFPDLSTMTGEEVEKAIVEALPVGALRRAAKKQGWGRVCGEDYCPGCMESM